ncbi:MAG: hypothetical protein ACP5H3_00700 [Candidatus Aenigmatarchaeota archaeon]|jgi:hypothetical protein
MRKYRKKFKIEKIAIAFLIILSIAMIIYSNNLFQKPYFVSNYTFEKKSGLLFEYEISKYPTYARILNVEPGKNISIGVVNDPWNLAFGEVPGKGSFVRRYVDLQNLNDKKVKIELKVYGNISQKVNFSENNFWLFPNETKRVTIFFFTNQTIEGYFEGEIDIIVKKAKYDFSYFFEKILW